MNAFAMPLKATFAAIVLLVTAFALRGFAQNTVGSALPDFRAFYCAASVASAGKDPYLQEPLYSCEAQQTAPGMWRAKDNVALPAPLPPYALAMFTPLAKLPYLVAAALWSAVIVLSYACTMICLRRLTGFSWPVLCFAILPASLMCISLGQIAPVSTALLAAAALLLDRGRGAAAGALAGLSLIEPHLALPSCAAMFVASRASRKGLLFAGAALLLFSVPFGAARTLEYLEHVLPAHAAAEVWNVGQFSGTLAAHLAGAPDSLALLAGSASYVVMAAVGIAVTLKLAKHDDRDSYLPLLPLAFTVFAGSFIHWHQIVAAIPAGLMLASRTSRIPYPLAAALVVMPVPWLYTVAWGFLIPLAAVTIGMLCVKLLRWGALPAAAMGIGACALLWLGNHGLPHAEVLQAFHSPAAPDGLADLSWGAYVRARIAVSNGIFLWAHIPTWLGVTCIAGIALRSAIHTNARDNRCLNAS
jgi:hypothetical protein